MKRHFARLATYLGNTCISCIRSSLHWRITIIRKSSYQTAECGIHNAFLLFELPVALFGQALALAALPRLSKMAAEDQYLDFRQLMMKMAGGAILISIPTAFLLAILGKPIIHIIFQHGAFTMHSSALTSLALIGYLIGLPGQVASVLLIRSFYALKNAILPLLTNIFAFVARISLLFFLLHTLSGKKVLLAIPLAAASSATAEAALLCLLLLWRLQAKIRRRE
jgi:putative peptidoglycan lipid II flippase